MERERQGNDEINEKRRSLKNEWPPFGSVGLSGFEPEQTEPKPVVLPLHHSPIWGAKVVDFFSPTKFFHYFFFPPLAASAESTEKHTFYLLYFLK